MLLYPLRLTNNIENMLLLLFPFPLLFLVMFFIFGDFVIFKFVFRFKCFIFFGVGDEIDDVSSPFCRFFSVTTARPVGAGWGNPFPRV